MATERKLVKILKNGRVGIPKRFIDQSYLPNTVVTLFEANFDGNPILVLYPKELGFTDVNFLRTSDVLKLGSNSRFNLSSFNREYINVNEGDSVYFEKHGKVLKIFSRN